MQLNSRETIQYMLRCPGGLHEWLMVARADKAKAWGLTLQQLNAMRTPIEQVEFTGPAARHGGPGSVRAHHELLELLESANSFEEFKVRLHGWAERRVSGGAAALPTGLHPAAPALPPAASPRRRQGQVAVWLAHQPAAEAFAAYLQETYRPQPPSPPLSPFAQDAGIGWYDHDFLEADHQASNPALSELLGRFSYAETFAAAAVEHALGRNIPHVPGIVLLYDHDLPVQTANGRVTFLGRWPYRSS